MRFVAAPRRLVASFHTLRTVIKPPAGPLAAGFALMAISRLCALVLPSSTKYLIDDVIQPRRMDLLNPLIAVVIATTVLQALSGFALSQLAVRTTQGLVADLRRRVHAHISRLPLRFYDDNKSGVLVSRIMTDVESLRNLVGSGLIDFAGAILTAILAMVILFRISAWMTCTSLLAVACVTLGLRKASAAVRAIFYQRSRIYAETTGRLTESISGVRLVKGYRAEEREQAVFAEAVDRLAKNNLRSAKAVSLMSLTATIALGAASAATAYLGAREIFRGSITLGDWVKFMAFLAMLGAPLSQFVNFRAQIAEALAALDRTREILNEPREDDDPHRTVTFGPLQGEIVFDNVSFGYEPGRLAVHGLSFRAAPGTVTALVGPTGSGKSTTASLVLAFYKPSHGVIRIDGVDLSTVHLDSYRSQLGVALQDNFFFDGSICDNVAFSKPGATAEEMARACRLSGIDRFPELRDAKTMVGERALRISGGQKQCVSMARALLADPRILILDEATSSMDTESESVIQEGLTHLLRERTTLVIAHRLATIRRADLVLFLEHGRIVERGTHESLYAARGRYYEMCCTQTGGELIQRQCPPPGDCERNDHPAGTFNATARELAGPA